MLARIKALEQMSAWARAGERETNGPNRSPLIDKINVAAGVPLGSPYCASAIAYAFQLNGINDFGGNLGDASVGFLEAWAKERGYLVTRPLAGDAAAWKLDGDNWPDHAIMVLKVRSWGGVMFTVDTVEANTSGSSAGSQDDGGGWYFRRRTFRRGRISFIRDPRHVPGTEPKPKPPKPKRKVANVTVDGELVLQDQPIDLPAFRARLPRLIARAKKRVVIDLKEK